jgi:hypothetical protein
VLEFVGGGSIEKRYQKMALSLQQILSMCRDTAAGMAHLVFHLLQRLILTFDSFSMKKG